MSNLVEKGKLAQTLPSERITITSDQNFMAAKAVPALSHSEAEQMALVELAKFVRLLGSLDEQDWNKPTACTLWNVRQVVAHLAGWMVAFTSFAALRHSLDSKLLKPYRQNGMNLLDAVNQLQVDERAKAIPAELISELAEAGALAIRNRAGLPLLLRVIPANIPTLGWVRLAYVTDLIGTRDMWMHRLDICRATGRLMEVDAQHDGRMMALVMRDLAGWHASNFKTGRVYYELEGAAGGGYYIGEVPSPWASLRVEALDFALLAAGRTTANELIAQRRLEVSGDPTIAELALANTNAPI